MEDTDCCMEDIDTCILLIPPEEQQEPPYLRNIDLWFRRRDSVRG
jgi:hypothetical protein